MTNVAPKKTKVLNLFGGPGIGKSTLAAALFAEMKNNDVNCELVREYVKLWAWQDRKIKHVDQIYVVGKQAQAESILYGKVDYVITDCPIFLPAVYQKLYYNNNISGEYIAKAAIGTMIDAECENEVTFKNYVLSRGTNFSTEGRYHDKEESIKIDKEIPLMLTKYGLSHKLLLLADTKALVGKILRDLGEKK